MHGLIWDQIARVQDQSQEHQPTVLRGIVKGLGGTAPHSEESCHAKSCKTEGQDEDEELAGSPL